jgi:LacI family transcriptional regulator
MKKYTTKDIAKMANVSRGTVDRVLHGRGKVSAKSEEKVRAVLEQIDYQPNVIARTLQVNKVAKFASLIPSPNSDLFWKKPYHGIEEALSDFQAFGINVDQHFFDLNEGTSFRKAAIEILNNDYDGLLIAPQFKEEAIEVLQIAERKKIPFVTFNSHIKEVNYNSFIGQNLYQSGRIVGDLLMRMHRPTDRFLIFHLGEEINNSPHMQEKESGFRDVLAYHGVKSSSILQYNIVDNGNDEISEVLRTQVSQDLSTAIFVTTSWVYEVAERLKPNANVTLIGYDLIEPNRKLLDAGSIDFLINQNPRQQAYQGISLLTDMVIFKKKTPRTVHLPIDIVTKENIATYL